MSDDDLWARMRELREIARPGNKGLGWRRRGPEMKTTPNSLRAILSG
jgi:hypothetical protein